MDPSAHLGFTLVVVTNEKSYLTGDISKSPIIELQSIEFVAQIRLTALVASTQLRCSLSLG